MMICTNQKEIMIYDEQDPEESKLLRRVLGGHKEEITLLAYDYHLSVIATGCINGEIAVYDFEMSKIEGLLVGHTGDITAIEFLSPYPMMVSASMDCTVCIWGIRPCPSRLQNVCIKRLKNVSWINGEDTDSVVSKILVWNDDKMKGIRKFRKQKQKMLPATIWRNFEHNFVFAFQDLDSIYNHEYPPVKFDSYMPSEKEKLEKVIGTPLYLEILLDEKSKTFIT